MERFQTEVTKELTEMRKLGIHVPDMAFALAASPNTMQHYESMGVSECTDLLINLSYC